MAFEAGGERASGNRDEFERIRARLAEAEREKQQALIRQAKEKAALVAEILKTRYSARRVILYGSLARGDFREGSDIDLLVEGMTGSYWDAYVHAERAAAPFVVSLVCAEDASPELLESVSKEGVAL